MIFEWINWLISSKLVVVKLCVLFKYIIGIKPSETHFDHLNYHNYKMELTNNKADHAMVSSKLKNVLNTNLIKINMIFLFCFFVTDK